MPDFEFQFTTGFTGQGVNVVVDGETRAKFTARSKFTTGLAHIVPMTLPDRMTATLQATTSDMPNMPPLSQVITVDATTPFVVIAWGSDGFEVSSTSQRPGYL